MYRITAIVGQHYNQGNMYYDTKFLIHIKNLSLTKTTLTLRTTVWFFDFKTVYVENYNFQTFF